MRLRRICLPFASEGKVFAASRWKPRARPPALPLRLSLGWRVRIVLATLRAENHEEVIETKNIPVLKDGNIQLVEKVFFDKLWDCRESYKMPFSSPRRRTMVLREGEKRANICKFVRYSMCRTNLVLHNFIFTAYFFLLNYCIYALGTLSTVWTGLKSAP